MDQLNKLPKGVPYNKSKYIVLYDFANLSLIKLFTAKINLNKVIVLRLFSTDWKIFLIIER
jgi:DNA-binding helix-hairpin-helix protein with protein kinase domain